jgi:hypothetical protein
MITKLSGAIFMMFILISAPFFAVQTEQDGINRVLSEDFQVSYIDIIGTVDYSLLFNAQNSLVSFPLHTSARNNIEFEVDIMFNDLPDYDYWIYWNGNGGGNGFGLFHWDVHPNKFTIHIPGEALLVGTTTMVTNVLYKVIVSRINNAWFMSVNGVGQNISSNTTGNIPTTLSRLGPIDDSVDYEISYFYITDGTNEHEYLFNEGTGTILNDNIGNKDGTIANATWVADTSGIIEINQTRSYYDIMENARLANYQDVDSFTNVFYQIPRMASSLADAYNKFINWTSGVNEFLNPFNTQLVENLDPDGWLINLATTLQAWIRGEED